MKFAQRIVFAIIALTFASLAHATVCSVGDRASVSWKGKWYPAKVLKVNEDQTRCYIRYIGYGDEWNEWVGESRIRVQGRKSSSNDDGFRVGDMVSVRWKGTWYPASVLSVRNGEYKIHYDGYGSNWDEWVGPSRIRGR